MNKKMFGAIFSIGIVFCLSFCLFGLFSDSTEAATDGSVTESSIFQANVSSILSLSIDSCGTTDPNTALLTVNEAILGMHFSSCSLGVRTTTNAPGYNLMIQAIDGPQRHNASGGNNWIFDRDGDGDVDEDDNYDNPYGDGVADGNTHLMLVIEENTLPTLPTLGSYNITPTNGTIASPTEMNASSGTISLWGFAVPKTQTGTASTGFDNAYTAYPTSSDGTSHGRYAKVPTTPSVIRRTTTVASAQKTDVFFGVSIAPLQKTGTYKGKIVFTAIANEVPSLAPTVTSVSPTSGSSAGGTTLNVQGTGFIGTTSVTIGGTDCGSIAVISSSHLTCVLPAKTAGAYPVVVTTVYDVSNNNVQYTYI